MLEGERLSQDIETSSSEEDFRLSISEEFEDDKPLSDLKYRRWFRPRFHERRARPWIVILVLVIVLGLISFNYLSNERHFTNKFSGNHAVSQQELKKPNGVPIVAVVFYGRRQFVNILDCYLQRNLARNGGWVDEVQFAVHSDNQEDLDWLGDLVARTPGYTMVDVRDQDFSGIWNAHLNQSDTLYIKLDDDITYIHDDAIPLLVQTLVAHPEAYAVTANLINSNQGSWIHYHRNAILPYLPEPAPSPAAGHNLSSWRASELQPYPEDIYPPSAKYNLSIEPPYDGHRWLPLKRDGRNIHKTPIDYVAPVEGGPAWKEWSIAAQQHYSLLASLEEGQLNRYFFGSEVSGDLWNLQNMRYSINFMAIWGATVQASTITGEDDELAVAVTNPKNMGRPFYIDSRAIVAHYSYRSQRDQLLKTDLLQRYLSLANEMACAKDNQKKDMPFI